MNNISEYNNSEEKQQEKSQIKLVDIPIRNENDALNLLVSFINLAQRRGCFNLDESAKIWECIKMFQKS